jgi:hypothetical protein
MNLVEMIADDQHDAPCKHGNIVDGHACYCHHESPQAPRKCPIWRNYGEHDNTKWQKGAWDDGKCPLFEPNISGELRPPLNNPK